MHGSEEDRLSLQRQLDKAHENLRLMQERISAFPLSTDIPLQLVGEERGLLARIAKLEQQLAAWPAEDGAELGQKAETLSNEHDTIKNTIRVRIFNLKVLEIETETVRRFSVAAGIIVALVCMFLGARHGAREWLVADLPTATPDYTATAMIVGTPFPHVPTPTSTRERVPTMTSTRFPDMPTPTSFFAETATPTGTPFPDIPTPTITRPPTNTPTNVPPTPTPPTPTNTPVPAAPVIHFFQSDHNTIDAGDHATLSWDLSNVQWVHLRWGSTEEGVVAPGNKTVAPDSTTTYTLIAHNAAGDTTAQLTITVNPGGPTVHASGVLNIPQTYFADLDSGTVTMSGADFQFEAQDATHRYVTPSSGVKLKKVSSATHDSCESASGSLSTSKININNLPAGSLVCVLTNEGRLAGFRVNSTVGPSPGTLHISFTTWD